MEMNIEDYKPIVVTIGNYFFDLATEQEVNELLPTTDWKVLAITLLKLKDNDVEKAKTIASNYLRIKTEQNDVESVNEFKEFAKELI